MAICNRLDILCFPPHTTHKLQHLDVGFISPLKSYINKEITMKLVGSSHIKKIERFTGYIKHRIHENKKN